MSLFPKTKSRQLFEKLGDLAMQMREMRCEIAIVYDRQADDEVEALVAERVRSGAAERTEDGTQALADFGIEVR